MVITTLKTFWTHQLLINLSCKELYTVSCVGVPLASCHTGDFFCFLFFWWQEAMRVIVEWLMRGLLLFPFHFYTSGVKPQCANLLAMALASAEAVEPDSMPTFIRVDLAALSGIRLPLAAFM